LRFGHEDQRAQPPQGKLKVGDTAYAIVKASDVMIRID